MLILDNYHICNDTSFIYRIFFSVQRIRFRWLEFNKELQLSTGIEHSEQFIVTDDIIM